MTERSFVKWFAILAVLGLCADQISKYVVFAWLYPGPEEHSAQFVVIPGYFTLQTNYTTASAGEGALAFLRTISGERLPHLNKGALFGVGNDHQGEGWNSVFAGISVAAAGFILFWVQRPNVAADRWLCIALGLILAGTLGNLYDRLVFGGVRDFIHWYYETHVWPDFNIADCCLVGGAGTLLVHSFFVKDPVAAPAKSGPALAEAPLQTTATTTGA
jgi:lipoprotein signal peptidase